MTKIGQGQDFQIESILVQPGRNTLSQGGEIIPLEPRIMDVLEYLAGRQGQVCSRDDIIEAIWKVEFGADESLTRAISLIRKAFRKAGGRGRFVQTISKRGYCLQASVTPVVENAVINRAPDIEAGPAQRDLTESRPTPPESTRPTENKPIKRSQAAAALSVPAPTVDIPVAAKVPETPIQPPTQFQPQSYREKPAGAATAAAPKGSLKKPIIIFGSLLAGALIGMSVWNYSGPSRTFGVSMEISEYGRSVAVMPFSDMSAAQDHQYFSDGLAIEILNDLGNISDLRVIAQSADTVERNKGLSYKDMGAELSVSHIVHGAIRTQGDRVRITAQLINTVNNQRAWSANYDGTLEDVFELQQNVSRDIATELTLILDLDLESVFNLGDPLIDTLTPLDED